MKQTPAKSVVCFGEVLWDILPSGPLPGGAPMNVSYHLIKLGSIPALITKIGHDDNGKNLVNLMSANGIATEYVDVDYDHPTGVVYAKLNHDLEVTYDFQTPCAWDFIEWKDEYVPLLESSDFFVYGSLASRNKTSLDTLSQLLEIARTKVLDINLRPPHFKRSLVEHLLGHADILKMNLTELELITGWFSNFQSISDRIQLVQDRFHIQIVIVTMGGNGAVVSDNGKEFMHPGFKVIVSDTIGSGDAFLAGFLSVMQQQESVQAALNYASAVGAYVATQQGGCPAYDLNCIDSLINSNSSQPTTLI
jgi:fructokinase